MGLKLECQQVKLTLKCDVIASRSQQMLPLKQMLADLAVSAQNCKPS